MDPVTGGYIIYRVWKWLKGKPDDSDGGGGSDGGNAPDLDDLL